jgi:MFS superfamily sulfate permease-like transporter
MLAGMPPLYGLYASIFPNLIYALLGTSRESPMAAIARGRPDGSHVPHNAALRLWKLCLCVPRYLAFALCKLVLRSRGLCWSVIWHHSGGLET